MTKSETNNTGASASPLGSRPSDQAQLHGPDATRVDPSRFAESFLSDLERRYILATPRQEPAGARFIAQRAGDRGTGGRFAGFARRYPWLFDRKTNKVDYIMRGGFGLDYRLSKSGVEVADAIAMEARQGGDGDNSAPSEGRQRGPEGYRP